MEPFYSRGGPLALSLILLLTTTVMAQEEQAIPLEPIHVTAPWPLTPPQYKEVSKVPYPEQARGRQEYGIVLLLLRVLSTGSVGEVKIKKSSGYSLLDDPALKGAKDWTFVPARRGPKAVEALVEIPVRFELVE
jgi:protein TonB